MGLANVRRITKIYVRLFQKKEKKSVFIFTICLNLQTKDLSSLELRISNRTSLAVIALSKSAKALQLLITVWEPILTISNLTASSNEAYTLLGPFLTFLVTLAGEGSGWLAFSDASEDTLTGTKGQTFLLFSSFQGLTTLPLHLPQCLLH